MDATLFRLSKNSHIYLLALYLSSKLLSVSSKSVPLLATL